MSTHFVGLDAGGTGTRALMTTASGLVVGRGHAAGANAWSSGASPADNIAAATRAALGDHDPASVAGGVIAVAGAVSSVPEQAAAVVRAWHGLGITAKPRIILDVVAIFATGTALPRGLVLAAGTGAIAALVDDGELVRRAGGRGWLVGDEGSAVWLGIEAVRAAVLALDDRGPATNLTEVVATTLGVPTDPETDVATRITDLVYAEPPARLGRLAPQVVIAAETGDTVALDLVESAAARLAGTAMAAAGEERPAVVVLGGSVLVRARPIRDRVRATIAQQWPQARIEQADSGEVGATAIAMRHAGGVVTPAMLAQLRSGGEQPD